MTATVPTATFDAVALRSQFPILSQTHNDAPITYLDSAASSQKPRAVLDAVRDYYERDNANVHRGVYSLSERATDAFEHARATMARFLGVPDPAQIIFTRNTSESINIVAQSWGRASLRPGDIIVTTEMEHHSNIVPWQIIAKETGARLEYIHITDDGYLRLDDLDRHLATGRVRLVACCQVSNMTGTINPIDQIIARAHDAGALVLVDGAQAAPHLPVNITSLDPDFYAFSGHKMCAPMGIGVLYGRRELLETMPPFLTGGSMIRQVGLHEASWAPLPDKFEAGTPDVAGAIGLGAACDYLQQIGLDAIHDHESAVTTYAWQQLSSISGLTIYGPPPEDRGGVIAFNLAGIHPHDVGSILDQDAVCVRAGHHCTQPLHARFGVTASTRASFYLYNTQEDVDRLVGAIQTTSRVFGKAV